MPSSADTIAVTSHRVGELSSASAKSSPRVSLPPGIGINKDKILPLLERLACLDREIQTSGATSERLAEARDCFHELKQHLVAPVLLIDLLRHANIQQPPFSKPAA